MTVHFAATLRAQPSLRVCFEQLGPKDVAGQDMDAGTTHIRGYQAEMAGFINYDSTFSPPDNVFMATAYDEVDLNSAYGA